MNLPVKNIVMWHTVAHVAQDNSVVGVEITTDPYDHLHKAAIVLHKSRSRAVALQIARFARRSLGIDRVSVNRANIPRDARIGYALSRSLQYAPNDRTPCQALVLEIAGTSIKELLARSDSGDNAARGRYFVLEIRDGGVPLGRIVSNKVHSVERMWREAPPNLAPRSELFVVGKYSDRDQAVEAMGALGIDYTTLWDRHPPAEYLERILAVKGDGVVFVRTGLSAVREYASGPMVVVGPHSYTKRQVLSTLQFGWWVDARKR